MACGGFFCNNNQPITQAAERIFFALDNGRIHMHVRIQYDGPPDQFGWLLPVPADDTLDVQLSTEALFDGLDTLYAPRFNVQRVFDENCPPPPRAEFAGDSATANSGEDGGVNVISREAIGPYDRVILQAQSVDELRTWLDEQSFFIPQTIDQKLGPYVERGQYFVAIKLLASASTDDIAPLYLSFVGNKPSIPIVPTSVAANPDMGVLVHMLYDQRAVPLNYLHVQINEAALDLSNGGQNYPDVVSQAMDEAGGKAFTTDFAGEIDERIEALVAPITEAEITGIETLDDLIRTRNFASDADIQRAANQVIMFPEDVTPAEFWRSPFAFRDIINQAIDTAALWAIIDTEINPARLELTRLMGAHRYLTRLYSTLSPDEMTLDPEFTFNPDMTDDVPNVRTIEVFISCSPDGVSDESTATLVNSAGETVAADLSGASSTRRENGETVQGSEVPASAIIEITGERGAPEIVGQMGEMDPSVIMENTGGDEEMELPSPSRIAPAEETGCDGCAQSSAPISTGLLGGLILLATFRRRRE